MEILKVTDKAFQTYGKVIQGIDVSDLLEALKRPLSQMTWYMWPLMRNWKPVPAWRRLDTAFMEHAYPGGLLQWK